MVGIELSQTLVWTANKRAKFVKMQLGKIQFGNLKAVGMTIFQKIYHGQCGLQMLCDGAKSESVSDGRMGLPTLRARFQRCL